MRKEAIILALALALFVRMVSANTAPLITSIDDEILVCESSDFSYEFNVAELDGELLTAGIESGTPFFVRSLDSENPVTRIEIYSGNLTKALSNIAYRPFVYISDGEFIDARFVTIKVFEKNNPPVIAPLSMETIDLSSSRTFQKKVIVSDIESGTPQNGGFVFNISDELDLLDMSIDNMGLISYNASESHLGEHTITVCVTDPGIENPEDKIGFCGQEITSTSCSSFQLLITETNSPPTIVLMNSSNTSSSIFGTQKTTFRLFKYDPDGLNPTTYWYVDGQLKQVDSGRSSDRFTYSFGCNVWGRHKISAIVSDGILNDSIEMSLDILKSDCSDGVIPRETIGEVACGEKWGCFDWGLCQNALTSHESGSLDRDSYEDLRQRCSVQGLNEEACGYQTRSCVDVHDCNTAQTRPLVILPCHFTLEPSCSDEIQNCHDGSCEILTDCGGPCNDCPTCSDGIRNQEEVRVDCGGPCADDCGISFSPEEEENVSLKQGLLVFIIFSLGFAIFQVVKIIREKANLEAKPKRGVIVQ